MFTGIQLKNVPDKVENRLGWSYKKFGEFLSGNNNTNLKNELRYYLNSTINISSNDLTNIFFPKDKRFDIFLSHSHKDLDKALNLSGFLKEKFDLNVFIDSGFWGNINELLKEIDNEFSRANWDSTVYDYHKRNVSTAHCHIMLATAIKEMIDQIECFIFLDTDEVINIENQKGETNSCWIYYELEISKSIQKRVPARFAKSKNLSNEYEFSLESLIGTEGVEIKYSTNTEHLIKKDFSILKKSSIDRYTVDNHIYPYKLDLLYKALEIIK